MLARILRPQGRKGEVLADLLTDFPERFADHPKVWLAPAGFTDRQPGAAEPPAPQEAEVVSYFLPVGRNLGRIVLHFAGISSISQAETLAGKEVVVPESERISLEPGRVYVADLVGATVFDRGHAIGVVQDVEFPTTPDGARRLDEAAPLLNVVDADGNELLIPFAEAYLEDALPEQREARLAHREIRMVLPEGLLDINRAPASPDDQDQ